MGFYKPGLESKNKIYSICAKLFYENGFKNTKISDISKEAHTQKSLFYHYYKNKDHIAFLITMEVGSYCNKIVDNLSHEKNDDILKMALHIKLFWKIIFIDPKLQRFYAELANETLTENVERSPFYQILQKISGVLLESDKLTLIQYADSGLLAQLTSLVYEKPNQYTHKTISDFYLKALFDFFNIDTSTPLFKQSIQESDCLLNTCIISNNGFVITCK
ncbi:MAG: TetR/AcrR family transcriptional regulator [Eubacteriaceae bacterium]